MQGHDWVPKGVCICGSYYGVIWLFHLYVIIILEIGNAPWYEHIITVTNDDIKPKERIICPGIESDKTFVWIFK